jgi:hypothetical protein
MQGDRWYRHYAKYHPRPDRSKLCGGVATGHNMAERCLSGERPVFVFWDHCHDHRTVRGALCHACNTEEALDARRSPQRRRDRFISWRTRCPQRVVAIQY